MVKDKIVYSRDKFSTSLEGHHLHLKKMNVLINCAEGSSGLSVTDS